MKKESVLVAVFLLALLTVFRLVDHPENMSPLWAICLFSGSYWRGSNFRFVIPLVGMMATDLYLGMYPGAMFTYAAVVLSTFVAPQILSSVFRVLLSGALATFVFFVVSNLGVWWSADLYPHTFAGLVDCLIMGIPFIRPTLEGTLIFSVFLYGLYRLILAPVGFTGFFKVSYGRH